MKLPPEYILHIGTIKVSCIKVVQAADGTKKIAAFSTRRADGFDRGVVKDLAKASQTLQETIQYVFDGSSESMVRAQVVVSHSHVKNFIFGKKCFLKKSIGENSSDEPKS